MRKTLSIVLTLLILLNTLGYYGLFLGWQFKSDLELTQKVDSEDYGASETLTISIPITIPYASDSRGFERVYGKFAHGGEFYQLIKQRLYKDTLYIVCVKDIQSKEIHQALTDYVRSFTDAPVNAQGSNGKLAPTFIKDYIVYSIGLKSHSKGWEELLSYSNGEILHATSCRSSINQPPELD